jgi:hypothetical protein
MKSASRDTSQEWSTATSNTPNAALDIPWSIDGTVAATVKLHNVVRFPGLTSICPGGAVSGVVTCRSGGRLGSGVLLCGVPKHGVLRKGRR